MSGSSGLPLVGGIEAGGTKFVCAVGTGPDDLRNEVRFPTTDPATTISRCVSYFEEAEQKFGDIAAVGIGSFGPVDPDRASKTFGYITSTPKKGWGNTDLAGPIARATGRPVGFDTDVNGAVLGEWMWGAGSGLRTVVYLTVGTGVGGGVVINGAPHHGMLHPEMGHVRLPRDPQRDPFPGICPYHGDCLEGLASGPAIERRAGRGGADIPPDDKTWDLVAEYLATALLDYTVVLSPERIILGGGVMDQRHLFPKIRAKFANLLNGYIRSPRILEHLDDYIVPPGLGNRAGVLGALALATLALAPK